MGQSNPVSDEFWDFLVENNLTDERVPAAANQAEDVRKKRMVHVDNKHGGVQKPV